MEAPSHDATPYLLLDRHVFLLYNTGMEQKPEVKQVTFVFPVEVLETMRRLAHAHQRSLVGEIVWALRQYLAQQPEGKK